MKGFLLFDIDGVIRDVTNSYRLAIQETVNHFVEWRPNMEVIDTLKAEGCWNNDWEASQEIIKRRYKALKASKKEPSFEEIVKIFNGFYFGGEENGDSRNWTGFIKNEVLLVKKDFFEELTTKDFAWGFVSGAEVASVKFVLENRLGLKAPNALAMGQSPEKPDPTGLLEISAKLAGTNLGNGVAPIGYLGDTVADVITVKNAEKAIPEQRFISFGIAPPHLHKRDKLIARMEYEKELIAAGADHILESIDEVIRYAIKW